MLVLEIENVHNRVNIIFKISVHISRVGKLVLRHFVSWQFGETQRRDLNYKLKSIRVNVPLYSLIKCILLNHNPIYELILIERVSRNSVGRVQPSSQFIIDFTVKCHCNVGHVDTFVVIRPGLLLMLLKILYKL